MSGISLAEWASDAIQCDSMRFDGFDGFDGNERIRLICYGLADIITDLGASLELFGPDGR